MSAVLLPKPSPSGVLVSTTRVAVLLVSVIEVVFLGVESPHMVPGITFTETSELATLELQE